MVRLYERLPIANEPIWLTFENEQSRSLLAGKNVHFVPYIAPRDYRGLARAFSPVLRIMRSTDFDVAISTGAAIAALVLPLARLQRREAWYIESVSRFDGPSLTGRILAKYPNISTYTQHDSWRSDRWKYRLSVLDDYTPKTQSSISTRIADGPLKVFVTLGTIARVAVRIN
jgi:hypothetical protein